MADSISSLGYARTNTTNSAGGTNYDAVFTDKTDNSIIDPEQFLNLLVVQMQNQDFTDPMDDTAYVTQMAQFSNMQQMQQLASYSKTSYALSLIGKTVTASRFTVSGDLDTTTGVIEKVSLVDDEYVIYVGGKTYTLGQIMTVQTGNSTSTDDEDDTKAPIDASDIALELGEVTDTTAVVKWSPPTEDEELLEGLTYTVYFSPEKPFDTVKDVENGIKFGFGQEEVFEEKLTGLNPNTIYYVNVVVEDADGNKTVYKPVELITRKEA